MAAKVFLKKKICELTIHAILNKVIDSIDETQQIFSSSSNKIFFFLIVPKFGIIMLSKTGRFVTGLNPTWKQLKHMNTVIGLTEELQMAPQALKKLNWSRCRPRSHGTC